MTEIALGALVSHYRILSPLGEGGMGVVYLAEDATLSRRAALKFLPEKTRTDPATLERFLREARAASALNHPGICTIYEFGEHDGRSFLAMEFLEGDSLDRRLSNQPMPLDFREGMRRLGVLGCIAGGIGGYFLAMHASATATGCHRFLSFLGRHSRARLDLVRIFRGAQCAWTRARGWSLIASRSTRHAFCLAQLCERPRRIRCT